VEDAEEAERMSKRLVKVTKQHAAECQRLLTLMGVPWLQAPSEAEAQCAELVRSGRVFAVGTEDMDALTFGAPVLLRRLTFSEAKKMPIQEFRLDKALQEMSMSQEQFVDLCILLGCDYCDSVRGVGPKKALEFLRKYGDIDNVLKHLDKDKYQVPENWQYQEARRLFAKPDVTPGDTVELKWSEPDEAGLIKFLVEENGFNEERVRSGAKRLLKAKQTTVQGRIDSFFSVLQPPAGQQSASGGQKRKSLAEAGKGPAAKKKAAGNSSFKKRK
uniref:Flap endonuclease 1 n=2 Tax=Macrostomum lignano TaxID=282301 RepID=A0A1I8FWP4_9PLAT